MEKTTDGGLTIGTHAPNDHTILFSLADYLKINDAKKLKEQFDLLINVLKTPQLNKDQKLKLQQQAQTLLVNLTDEINNKFTEILKNKTLHTHFPDIDKINANTFKQSIEKIKEVEPNSLMLYWLTHYGTTLPHVNAFQEEISNSGISLPELKELQDYFTKLLKENKVPLVMCMWNRDIETRPPRNQAKKSQILLKDFGNFWSLPTDQKGCLKKFFGETPGQDTKRLLCKHKNEYYFVLLAGGYIAQYLKLKLTTEEKTQFDKIDFKKQNEMSYDTDSVIYKL